MTGATIADATVTGANIASGTINGSNINPLTTITAGGFVYPIAQAKFAFADPTWCQRANSGTGPGGSVPPYQDVAVLHPEVNAFGPSVQITNFAQARYSFHCPVTLPLSPGQTARLVGATMAFSDLSSLCFVGAQLRTKDYGTNGNGTIVAGPVFSGTGATDYATVTSQTQTKVYTFASPTGVAVNALTMVSIEAFVDITSGAVGVTDCRYSGTLLTYTVDRP